VYLTAFVARLVTICRSFSGSLRTHSAPGSTGGSLLGVSRATRHPTEALALARFLASEEAQRVLAICNACRYCEGFCAVFPALERRLEFVEADVHYLANLCHNCGSCLYACQYAPPHEFALNFPKVLAQVRGETYRRYAWPQSFARAFDRNALVVSIATALSIAAE